MSRYIIKRLISMVFVVLGVAVLIFTIMYFTPGDPVRLLLGSDATPADIAKKAAQLGLDQPYIIQLGRFLTDLFFRFDFGTSYIFNSPVISDLFIRVPYTLAVGMLCMLLQVGIGIPLGVTAAVNQNRSTDRICMFIALFGVSIPSFWLGLMLVLLFALHLGILPPFGVGGIEYFVLPCIANSFSGIATQARQTRSSMLEVIRSDYITTARAKGMRERDVIYKHALPNALIPVITVIGNGFAMMLGGAVVIENVFSIPGVGMFMTNAITSRDYPVVRGSVVFLSIVFSFVILLVDIIYAYVNPRIKAQYESGQGRMSHA